MPLWKYIPFLHGISYQLWLYLSHVGVVVLFLGNDRIENCANKEQKTLKTLMAAMLNNFFLKIYAHAYFWYVNQIYEISCRGTVYMNFWYPIWIFISVILTDMKIDRHEISCRLAHVNSVKTFTWYRHGKFSYRGDMKPYVNGLLVKGAANSASTLIFAENHHACYYIQFSLSLLL